MIFEKALPVWQSGKENEMNIFTDFAFTSEKLNKAVLRVTGSSAYQVFVNGRLCCYGPARMAEGYIAVDEIELPETCSKIEILVRFVGYNCRSFNQINNASFAIGLLLRPDAMDLYVIPYPHMYKRLSDIRRKDNFRNAGTFYKKEKSAEHLLLM